MKPLWLSFALWLILFSATAQKIAPPLGGQTGLAGGAVIIGISHYKELDSLQFAHRDAAAFAEFLKTQKVPEDNIKLFLNQDATRFAIVDELYNITQTLKKGDRFYFYFGGHGDLEAKIGYQNSLLLLYNSPKKDYFQNNEYLQLSELKTWFEVLTQKGVEVVFIADACHSGGLIGGKEGLTKTQRALQESWQGITKILSSQANEFSLEGKQWGGGRGLFSYHLVNGLAGLADANKDKKVSLQELNKYLSINVVREADPNVQTPVIQGNNKQLLAKIDAASLKKLQADLMRSVPIITEVNLKTKEALMIGELDKTLTDTYEKFKKALEEKRLNTFDNEKDYALLHYRKLAAAKLPQHLLTIMKRNLGAALMERELEVMKDVREKGVGYIAGNADEFLPVIRNLEETMKLLGEAHHFYSYIKARMLILESARLSKMSGQLKKRTESLFIGAQLEPNMVSTYVLLSSYYRDHGKPDSAIYYQEKVVNLLPNQAYAYLNLAASYTRKKYTDVNNQRAPHPKAIEYYEKAIEVEPAFHHSYMALASLYMGNFTTGNYHNYPKAIPYLEKVALLVEQESEKVYQERVRRGLNKFSQEPNWPYNQNDTKLGSPITVYINLYTTYRETGNIPKAQEYLTKLHQKLATVGLISLFLDAATNMSVTQFLSFEKDDTYQHNTLYLLQSALKMASEDLKAVPAKHKPYLTFQYRELLKSLGAVHRTLKNYTEAEKFLQRAIDYPVLTTPLFNERFIWRGFYNNYQNRLIPMTFLIVSTPQQNSTPQYNSYFIDSNVEMTLLKLEQNKSDEALTWVEKAIKNPASKNQNFFETIFSKVENLNKEAYQVLLDKYFPPSSDEKK